jgi:mono/diheme cytochrome c family protein
MRKPPRPNKLMFPFNLRFGLYFWNLLFADKSAPRIPPGAGAEWKRGEYLVNGLGHCAACHTPKNLLFGDETSRPLAGGLVDNWLAPDITNGNREGLGAWSHRDLVSFLTTGRNRFTTVAGSMKEKVSTSISHMRDSDVRAIAVYLKSLPGVHPLAWETPRPEELRRGQGIYTARCAGCHGEDGITGKGKTAGFPGLARNTMVMSHDATSVLRIILTGGDAPPAAGRPPLHAMPGFGGMDDGEIADVATYIRNSWGNSAPPVSATDVHGLRQALAKADSH